MLVHCRAGVSRSASIVIVYVMRKYNIPLREAYERVHAKRPVIAPNNGFWRQMIRYEEYLRGEGTASVKFISLSEDLEAPDISRMAKLVLQRDADAKAAAEAKLDNPVPLI